MKGVFDAVKYLLVFFLFSYTAVSLSLFLFLFHEGVPTGQFIGPPPSIVTRTFNDSDVSSGKEITVTLTLNPLWAETYYALEEGIPADFTILDTGGANTDESPYILRWYYIDLDNPDTTIPSEELTKTYHLRTPQTGATYRFSGQYQFEGDPQPANTTGTYDLTVISCENQCDTQGETSCTADGFSVLTCGNWDADPCLEWGQQTACGTLNCNADICQGTTYSDFPLPNSAIPGTCQRTCISGACFDCNSQTGTCTPFTETCEEAIQCQTSSQACGGTSHTCHNDGAWLWDTITTETHCRDTFDNDCDNTCDYDGENCAIGSTHGDSSCPVEIQAISVTESNPEENSQITILCTANAEVTSVYATIDDTSCTGTITWNGNIAEIPCNVGSYQTDPKTVTCKVNNDKSFQTGDNLTTTITLQESICTGLLELECGTNPVCEWCLECSGTQGNGLSADTCVPAGGCTYSCDITSTCGAECDIINDCPLLDCETACINTTHILERNDLAGSCDYGLCGCSYDSCEAGTERTCTPTTCEETYPGQHLVGTCDNTCEALTGDDACTTCTPTYPGNCACEEGWYDSDGNTTNGCESNTTTECTEPWICGAWSGDGCGTRDCTCACPGGIGCSGDSTETIECPSNPGGGGGGGGGGSPTLFKGGGGGIPPDKCDNGYDDEGSPARQNGCIDADDWWCGGTETYCWDGVDNDCDGDIDCDDTDCALDSNCQEEIIEEEQPPVYSIGTLLENIFTEYPQDQTAPPETFETQTDVTGFFGFMNWTIIALLAILFIGLIFIDHIKPGRITIPVSHLDAVGGYIYKKLNDGVSPELIKARLKSVGWIDEVIDDNFKKVETIRSKKTIPTETTPPAK